MNLKVGDVVMLNSGSSKMVVEEIVSDREIMCVWHRSDIDIFERGCFNPLSVKKVEE